MATTTEPDAGMLASWYDSYKKTNPTTTAAAPAAPTFAQPGQQAAVTNWTPDKQSTVQGQLASVLDSGSPLMDRAATKAAQTMNQRGLLNSSMAVGAGQAALYDAALPIAQADANTFAAAGKSNTDAANASAQQYAGFTQATNLQNAGFANDAAGQQRELATRTALADQDVAARMTLAERQAGQQQMLQQSEAAARAALQEQEAASQMRLQADNNAARERMQQYELAVQKAMSESSQANQIKLANMDRETRTQLAQIEADFKTELQTSQSVAVTYQSMTDSITRIMMDPNMDADGKNEAIANTVALYRNQMAMQSAVSGLNLGQIIGELTVSKDGANAGGSTTAPATGTGGTGSGTNGGDPWPGGSNPDFAP